MEHKRKFLLYEIFTILIAGLGLISIIASGDNDAADDIDDISPLADAIVEAISKQTFSTYHNKNVSVSTNKIGADCSSGITYTLSPDKLCYERKNGNCTVTVDAGTVQISGDYTFCLLNSGATTFEQLTPENGIEGLDGINRLAVEGDIDAIFTTNNGKIFNSETYSFDIEFSDIEISAQPGTSTTTFSLSMTVEGSVTKSGETPRNIEDEISFTLTQTIQ